MLIEIHMIQNHSPSNINRDDLGAPKTAMFGGVPRARISSQCLKRSIRNPASSVSAISLNMKDYLATRTKQFPELVEKALSETMQELPQSEQLSDGDRKAMIDAAKAIGKPEEKKKPQAEPDDAVDETAQLISLLPNEVRGFVETLQKLRKQMPGDYAKFLQNPSRKGGKDPNTKKNRPQASEEFYELLRAARTTPAVDTALFGRMTTSPAFDDFEAAMEVAHAISTHEVQNEVDYFTAVDDLAKGSGAGHVGEKQQNSATYYKYFSLDWDQFVTNLRPAKPERRADEADEAFASRTGEWQKTESLAERLAARAVGHFIEAAAHVVPSGMKKGHAHNNLPDGILVEIKPRKIPTSYANAFAEPVTRSDERGVIAESIARLGHYVGCIVNGYGIASHRYWFSPEAIRLQYRDVWGDENAKAVDVADAVKSLSDLVARTVGEVAKAAKLVDGDDNAKGFWRELCAEAAAEQPL